MSVSRGFAQRVTKNFAAVGETRLFLEEDFDNWVAANSNNVSRLGSTFIVTDALVTDVLRGVNGFTVLEHSGNSVYEGKSLNDLGKELRVGSLNQSEYVTFRKIQVGGQISNAGGGGSVGYVVIDNNCDDLTRPRFEVHVARV